MSNTVKYVCYNCNKKRKPNRNKALMENDKYISEDGRILCLDCYLEEKRQKEA